MKAQSAVIQLSMFIQQFFIRTSLYKCLKYHRIHMVSSL